MPNNYTRIIPETPLPISMLPENEPLASSDLLLVTQPNNPTGGRQRKLPLLNLLPRFYQVLRSGTITWEAGSSGVHIGTIEVPVGCAISGGWYGCVYGGAREGSANVDFPCWELECRDTDTGDSLVANGSFQIKNEPSRYYYPMVAVAPTEVVQNKASYPTLAAHHIALYIKADSSTNVDGWYWERGQAFLLATPCTDMGIIRP